LKKAAGLPLLGGLRHLYLRSYTVFSVSPVHHSLAGISGFLELTVLYKKTRACDPGRWFAGSYGRLREFNV